MQPDRHLFISTSSHHQLPSKPIPPPLTLLPLPSSSSNTLEDGPASDLENNMTARCSQFPPDILDSRPALASLATARYQPYLNNLNSDPSPWPDNSSSSSSIGTQSFRLDSPRSTSTNELSSSFSSTAPPPTFLPSAPNPEPGNIKFDASSDPAFYGASYSSNTPHAYQHSFSNSDYNPHIHVPPPQPRHSLPLQYSAAVVPPATAFTPSGGSPPLLSNSLFTTDSASRRHTVSALMPPSGFEIGFGRHDLEETILKDEKRRRNKESSQRFRDRTRERQREKQERLEYLERRIKDLEIQLKQAKASNGSSVTQSAPAPPIGQLVGANETALSAMQRLQRENESLRTALKTAEQEIHRLRPGQQTMTPSTTTTPSGAFNVGQVFTSLAQLSPSASGGGGGNWSESESSPSAEPTTYFPNSTRTSSPASDTCPPTNSQRFMEHRGPPTNSQRFMEHRGPPPPQATQWDTQNVPPPESVGLVNWPMDPSHPQPQQQQQRTTACQPQLDQFH